MCRSPTSHFLHVIGLLYFCEVNTRSRKSHTLDYCRLSTLALLLVNKVDLPDKVIQIYSKSEKRKEYICTFFTLSVCMHVINTVNFMDNLWYSTGDAIYITRDR